MPIAQMSWGRMRYPPSDPAVKEFMDGLETVYALAAMHPGFLWRIPDDIIAIQLNECGFDERMSATVSVWQSVGDLRDYTWNTLHGEFLKRSHEWFDKVDGPQLVIWDVDHDARPNFFDALKKLAYLKENSPTPLAYGWNT